MLPRTGTEGLDGGVLPAVLLERQKLGVRLIEPPPGRTTTGQADLPRSDLAYHGAAYRIHGSRLAVLARSARTRVRDGRHSDGESNTGRSGPWRGRSSALGGDRPGRCVEVSASVQNGSNRPYPGSGRLPPS